MRSDIEALAHRLANNPKQRIFGYCRISSSKQEQGLSIPAQEAAIRAYCKEHGLDEPEIVTETSTAGKRMFALPRLAGSTVAASVSEDEDEDAEQGPCRPRLLLLLGHLTSLSNAHLIVWRLDRVARINDEREVLHQLLLRNGVKLHSTDKNERAILEHGDPNDPMAALVRQIFGAFSQYEKAVIELRMQTGMRFKAAKGGFTGGRVAFGYDVVEGELVVNETNARLVRYIFFLRHRYSMTLRSIGEHIGQAVEGGLNHVKIHRILKNEALYRGAYKDRYGTIHQRPDLRILTDSGDYDYAQEFAS